MSHRAWVSAASVLAVLGLAAGAAGQTATGQILGRVRDATGALVSGAAVTVEGEGTGLTRETTTGKAGDYVVPLLPVGAYSVTARFPGFRAARVAGVRLNVDQVVRADLGLLAGDLTDAVEVRARAVALDASTGTVGQVITERQITDLPLNGRNFLQLLFLGAGAVETTGEQALMRQGVGNAISLMGGRPTSNNYMIDGTANVDTALGTPAAILSLDAIAEFKEQTRTYSAEYGFSANQVNLVSKSGSNELHGSLFGFLRKDGLDARNFFDPKDAPKPKLDQKQFGGVVSGPIVRDKTFFLASYEGTRVERGSSAFYTVPTPDELAGHFSSTIVDPVTGQPFANDTIPAARFSRLAEVALREGWYPAPNTSAPQGNYQVVRTLPQTQDQWTLRLDQDLGRFGRAFARFTKTSYDNRTSTNLLEIGDSVVAQDTTQWQVSHTWPVRSNLVNALRVGRLVARADQHGIPCPTTDVDFLDFTGVFQNIPDEQRECPQVGISGYSGTGGAVNAYAASRQPMWDVSNGTTWVRGSQTLSFGLGYRRFWLQRDLATGFLGNHGYGLGGTTGFTGNSVADFLLGYFSGGSVFQPAAFSVPGAAGNPREFNFSSIAPYVQDDWRVGSRLTLNLGLRWDYRSVPYETNDRMAWRNPSYAPGGLLVADRRLVEGGIVDGGYYQYAGRRSPLNPDRFKVFAPRLSFAWRPAGDERTVVRGGYGLFYDSAEGREIDGSSDVYPYVSRGNYVQSLGQPTPLMTTDQLYPSFTLPGAATPAANTFLAVTESAQPRNPRVHQWSLGVQRQLLKSTVLELNYVGAHGADLLMRQNIAQALPYTPDHPSVASRKPYPNFEAFIDSNWGGSSDYHGLNLKLEHHGRDLLLTLAYTWAKSTDTKSAAAGIGDSAYNGWQGFLDNHDPTRDHGLSDFDVDHRAVLSFVWNLPFGRGGRFAGDARGLKDALVSGWQINGIYTWQRGFPLTIEAADLGGVLDTFGANRADVVGDIHRGGGAVGQWFNTAAFAQPALGSFGDSGRNILRGPGIDNLDLSLFKTVSLSKGARMQVRFESFNVFNHPQFAGVSTNIAAPNFGVVTAARPGRINQVALKLLW